jgi:hypothetical protein
VGRRSALTSSHRKGQRWPAALDCEQDIAEQTAAAALRALGLQPDEAKSIASRRLGSIEWPSAGLFAEPNAAAA